MTDPKSRVPAILDDIERFAVSARRVVARGYERFMDPEDDDQRRIARSLMCSLTYIRLSSWLLAAKCLMLVPIPAWDWIPLVSAAAHRPATSGSSE